MEGYSVGKPKLRQKRVLQLVNTEIIRKINVYQNTKE